jgi:hypothetical protein
MINSAIPINTARAAMGIASLNPSYETDSTFDFNIRIFGAIVAPAGSGVAGCC